MLMVTRTLFYNAGVVTPMALLKRNLEPGDVPGVKSRRQSRAGLPTSVSRARLAAQDAVDAGSKSFGLGEEKGSMADIMFDVLHKRSPELSIEHDDQKVAPDPTSTESDLPYQASDAATS